MILEDGKTYLNTFGERVKVQRVIKQLFISDTNNKMRWYKESGECCLLNAHEYEDLIAEAPPLYKHYWNKFKRFLKENNE